jgi:hypothetical protein
MAQPPHVDIEGVGPAYARIYGFRDDDNQWQSESRPPPIKPSNTVEAYVTRLPFAIGERY